MAFFGMGVCAPRFGKASLLSVLGTRFASSLTCPPGSLDEEEAEHESEGQVDGTDDEHFEYEPVIEKSIIEAAGDVAPVTINLVAKTVAMFIALLSLAAFVGPLFLNYSFVVMNNIQIV